MLTKSKFKMVMRLHSENMSQLSPKESSNIDDTKSIHVFQLFKRMLHRGWAVTKTTEGRSTKSSLE